MKRFPLNPPTQRLLIAGVGCGVILTLIFNPCSSSAHSHPPETKSLSKEEHWKAAKSAEAIHDFETALYHLTELTDQSPASVEVWSTRAILSKLTGDLSTARSDATVVSTLSKSAYPHVLRAHLAIGTSEALVAFDELCQKREALRSEPDEIRNWADVAIGELAYSAGKLDIAERAFQHIRTKLPDDSEVTISLCDLLIDQDRTAEISPLVEQSQSPPLGLLVRFARFDENLLPQVSHDIAHLLHGGHRHDHHDHSHDADASASAIAYYFIHLNPNQEKAIEWSQKAFNQQKTHRTARLVLDAFVNQPEAQSEFRTKLLESGISHSSLE